MDFASILDSIAHLPPWVVYVAIMAAPFVQEDAAVIGTAALAASGTISVVPAIIAIFIGLCLSDYWKYWIGWVALRNEKGAAFSKRDKVLSLQDKVLKYPFTTLMTARFIPLTRIPVYIACGFFNVSYLKYCMYVAITAALYVAIFFSVFILLGALMAEQLQWLLPLLGITFAVLMVGYHVWKSRRQP